MRICHATGQLSHNHARRIKKIKLVCDLLALSPSSSSSLPSHLWVSKRRSFTKSLFSLFRCLRRFNNKQTHRTHIRKSESTRRASLLILLGKQKKEKKKSAGWSAVRKVRDRHILFFCLFKRSSFFFFFSSRHERVPLLVSTRPTNTLSVCLSVSLSLFDGRLNKYIYIS